MFGGTAQHPLCDDSMNFFRLASKSGGPSSSILCKLGMDPNFQLFLHSSVQGDTCRGYGPWWCRAGREVPSAGALWKAHLGMQLLPSLVWGLGERRKYRAGGYIAMSKDWPLCPSFFHLESLTMCLFCVQWKTHFHSGRFLHCVPAPGGGCGKIQ